MRHSAYVFDAYRTLFDVHAAVRRHADEVRPDRQLFSEIWRAKQLEYSWVPMPTFGN
jgi:2-haloacid dehalogenase